MKNFGVYKDKEITLQDNMFILFKGVNGSGKSTIFMAIQWALYGGRNQKRITHGETSCTVTLTACCWTVKRCSKPVTLHVTIKNTGTDNTPDDLIYEGATAQGIIEDKIMKMNQQQFLLSTMITGPRSSLATISPTERYQVIRELASTQDKPKIDAEKISNMQKTLSSTADMSQGERTTLQKQIQEKFSTTIPEKVTWDPEKYKTLKTNLQEKKQLLQKWQSITNHGISKDEAIEKLEQLNNLNKLRNKIATFKKYLQYTRHKVNLEEKLQQYKDGVTAHFKQLQKELTQLKNDNNISETGDNLFKIATANMTRQDEKDEGNPYWNMCVDEITSTITEIEKCIQEQKEKNEKQRLENLVSHTKQPCPSCNAEVAIKNSKIILWSSIKKHTEEIIQTVSGDLTKKSMWLGRLKTIKYDYDPEAVKKWEYVNKTNTRIQQLERQIQDQVLPAHLVSLKKSFGEKLSIPAGYKEKYTIEYLEERVETLIQEIATYPDEDERNILTQISTSKTPTREKMEQLAKEIASLDRECDEMRDAESKYRDYRDYKDLKKKLDKVDQRDKEMADKQIALKRLQVIQKESASMSLESIINTINGYAEEFLSKFFDETISVRMTNVKETQTKVEYSLVNIDLNYNDKKYIITDFSQGELIKINLSFILAMNRLQGSTYLFLDEILQNLDKGVLLEIYACLKSITKDVSVFIIDHNSNEGFFDDVVEFAK